MAVVLRPVDAVALQLPVAPVLLQPVADVAVLALLQQQVVVAVLLLLKPQLKVVEVVVLQPADAVALLPKVVLRPAPVAAVQLQARPHARLEMASSW